MHSLRARRLLLVITRLSFFGGAEVQLVHLAKGLARLGHEVTLCSLEPTPVDPAPLAEQGVELVSLEATGRYRRLAVLPRLIPLARRADVVHCTMWDASLWGRLAAIVARRPAIVADHAASRAAQVSAKGAPRASWIARHNRLLDRFTYATVACATAQFPILEAEGVNRKKIVYIPNGIPVDELLQEAESGPSRGELGIPEEGPLALQIGVFRPEKNQVGAVEAFERVRERVAGAQLVFAGEGETRAKVEERAREGGDGIHFLGPRRDVPGLLALADAMLLPSLSDAMPMTVLEAMALGVPVIASDVGDTRAALTDEAGICIPAGDTGALADAWTRVLTDDGLRVRLGAAGGRRARQFDASVMAHSYSDLFEAACGEGAPQAALSAVR